MTLPATEQDEASHEIIEQMVRIRSGPLPSPEDMARYNAIQPDAADRIIRMAEKEQERSIYISKRFDAYKSRGQHYALTIVLAAFGLHGYLAFIGHVGAGFIISLPALLSIVAAFIYGERKKD